MFTPKGSEQTVTQVTILRCLRRLGGLTEPWARLMADSAPVGVEHELPRTRPECRERVKTMTLADGGSLDRALESDGEVDPRVCLSATRA